MKIRELVQTFAELSRVILRGGQLTLPLFVLIACTAAPELQPSVETVQPTTAVPIRESLSPTPTSTPDSTPVVQPSPGFIVYTTFPGREVLMIDPDEDKPVRLTTLPSSAFFPAISPDANQIVYVDVQDGSNTYPILVMDINNGDLKQIASDFEVFGGSLVWSPDGGSIAFAGNRDDALDFPNIYIADMQDQTITQVSDNSLAEYDLAWSPNGESFAFRAQVQSGETFTHCLFKIDRDGSNLTQLTDPSLGDAAHPSWSPDGQYLAFDVEALEEDSGDIFVMAQDGSDLTRLTTHPGNDQYPTWSTDGSQLAFISDREGYNAIYIMNMDEDGLLRLTDSDLSVGRPVWFGSKP